MLSNPLKQLWLLRTYEIDSHSNYSTNIYQYKNKHKHNTNTKMHINIYTTTIHRQSSTRRQSLNYGVPQWWRHSLNYGVPQWWRHSLNYGVPQWRRDETWDLTVPPEVRSWGAWSMTEDCSVTCGRGLRKKSRFCEVTTQGKRCSRWEDSRSTCEVVGDVQETEEACQEAPCPFKQCGQFYSGKVVSIWWCWVISRSWWIISMFLISICYRNK